ncbi:hypothetical protein F3Y22_tig00001674pilonHSYRG00033 [Hibiscus syriacus]|uniref:Uncharacterized protein n=1 Tax=Hibiscus syriacus TaxID=106335 RepID=A0A6A3CZN3_HIBSY|nr:hypothetical protein F3Y22_tig00001674pilonHSYRG00033 [Hibiscus syriacus]
MGFKRPFEDEELQELPFKNWRQFGYNDKPTRCAVLFLIVIVLQNLIFQWYEEDSETTAPISLVTSTSSEEDTGTGVAAISPKRHIMTVKILGWEHVSFNADSDLSANQSGNVAAGRTDCSCLDRGSSRSYKWSEEDEETFHEVVYNNPVSLGKKFWKQLSSSLDIDSDDEFYGNQQPYKVQALEEDEDSIESLADQEDNNNGDDDSGNSYGDNGVEYYSRAATREDYGTTLPFKGHATKSFDASRFDSVFQQTDKGFRIMEDINVQYDPCMSFEFQPNMIDAHNLIDTKANLHVSGTKSDLSKSLQQGKLDEASELVKCLFIGYM